MRTKHIKAIAVLAQYKSTFDTGGMDVLDSWFKTKREAQARLTAQHQRYPGVKFYLCDAIAWQDSEHSHWHVKRA